MKSWLLLDLQSSAVITWCNILWYYIYIQEYGRSKTNRILKFNYHHPPPLWVSYGVSVVKILQKIDCAMLTQSIALRINLVGPTLIFPVIERRQAGTTCRSLQIFVRQGQTGGTALYVQGLTLSIWLACLLGTWFGKFINVPCKKFYVPSQYLYKPCKPYKCILLGK